MKAAAVRRRGVLVGAAALALASCERAGKSDTIAPEDLPPPPSDTPPRPDALLLTGPGVALRLFLPVHVERMSADPLAPVRIVSDASVREIGMLFAASEEPPPDEPQVRRVGQGAWLELDPEADLAKLGEAVDAPRDADRWTLGLGDATFDWPPGLVVDAYAGEVPRVELRRFADPRDVMIVVRGPLAPEQVPSLDELVGPGQQQAARQPSAAPPWIEVTYSLGEETWRQRHWRAKGSDGRIALVTAQATADTARRVIADGDVLARSLAFTPR